MLGKISRAYAVMRLTRRYFRPNQVPTDSCVYYIDGTPKTIYGQNALVMLIGIVLNDTYGLKRFKYLENIVDIGANIGVFSLYAALSFPQTKIFAYEPCILSNQNLDKNLSQLNNVYIYPYAVGGVTKKVRLNYQDDLSACYVRQPEELITSNSQDCDMLNFDEITEKLKSPIGLLKLDCEGSEYEIIQTPSFEKVRYVVGEFHTCEQGNPELGIKLLQERGFIIDRWLPFPDGKAGEFWASNSRNTAAERAWLR